jgi:hypothetical protein
MIVRNNKSQAFLQVKVKEEFSPKCYESDTGQRGRLVHNEQLNPSKAGFEMTLCPMQNDGEAK